MNPLHVKLGAAALAILIVGAAGGYWLAQRTEPGDAGAGAAFACSAVRPCASR